MGSYVLCFQGIGETSINELLDQLSLLKRDRGQVPCPILRYNVLGLLSSLFSVKVYGSRRLILLIKSKCRS